VAFARNDIGQETMMVRSTGFFSGSASVTTHAVGGFTGGAMLQIGLRFDTTRPFNALSPAPVPKG